MANQLTVRQRNHPDRTYAVDLRRLRLLSLLLVAVLTAALLAVPSASAAKPNWVLQTFEADFATRFHVAQRIKVGLIGPGPWVFGFAVSVLSDRSSANFSDAFVFTLGGSDMSVRTSGGAGGVHQRITPVVEVISTGGRSFEFRFTLDITLGSGQRFSTLLFLPNATMKVNSAEVLPSFAIASHRVTKGSGATAMLVAGSKNRGTSASVGPVGAGGTSYAAKTRGLVGAMEGACNCNGSWSGPGRRSGAWMSVTGDGIVSPLFLREGHMAFAGPAGNWSWSWTGASDAYGTSGAAFGSATTPIIGAWAPIGNDWRLFRYMRPYESSLP